MRPRKQAIRESFEELDELRRYYTGTVDHVKLLFLRLLKEDPQRPLSEAARKAGISERRGRYWWETYCSAGLRGLLERRVWGRRQLEKSVPKAPTSPGGRKSGPGQDPQGLSPATQIDYPAFINGVAGLITIENPVEWTLAFRDLIVEHFPEVDYCVVSIRPTVDAGNRGKSVSAKSSVLRQHGGKVVGEDMVSVESNRHNYQEIIESGRKSNFDFDRYHFPPSGFDLFAHPGKRDRKKKSPAEGGAVILGSMLLFRRKSLPPFSPETLDLVERLRPYLTYVFSDYIIRVRQENAGSTFTESTTRIAVEAGLSNREQDVLTLLFLGYSEKRVAQALSISTKTVESHVNSIYRKTGVSKVTELFAQYQTPMGYTRPGPDQD